MIKKFNEFIKENIDSKNTKEIVFDRVDKFGNIDKVVVNAQPNFPELILDDDSPIYKISFDEMKSIIKKGYFNDDEWGQMFAIYDIAELKDEDGENWNWIYIEDISDDEEFELLDDYEHFFIRPSDSVEVKK